MEILSKPDLSWSGEFGCLRCGTRFRADQDDLQIDGFKVSGYHFAGTAVCADKLFVTCPGDGRDILLGDREDGVPVLLRDRLRAGLAAKRRERGY